MRDDARRPVSEVDQRVLVHPDSLFDVSLSESRLSAPHTLCALAQTRQRLRSEAGTERCSGFSAALVALGS
jgi:hypothetical protein